VWCVCCSSAHTCTQAPLPSSSSSSSRRRAQEGACWECAVVVHTGWQMEDPSPIPAAMQGWSRVRAAAAGWNTTRMRAPPGACCGVSCAAGGARCCSVALKNPLTNGVWCCCLGHIGASDVFMQAPVTARGVCSWRSHSWLTSRDATLCACCGLATGGAIPGPVPWPAAVGWLQVVLVQEPVAWPAAVSWLLGPGAGWKVL
jgi:hypothetical protein